MDALRVAGAPGAGKSAAAWAIAQRFAADGHAMAYVDIDQLGMCYPAPAHDPDRWALKEEALARVAGAFRYLGADRLVVSGVARPDASPPTLPGARASAVWLDADADTRRARLAPRGWPANQVEATVAAGTAAASRLDPAWRRIPTDAHTLDETVSAVLAVTDDASGRPPTVVERGAQQRDETPPTPDPVDPPPLLPVRWITGPRGAGASRIGWELASSAWREGRPTGFVDLAQLSFAANLGRPVGLRTLLAVRDVFAGAGAHELVVVAPFAITPQQVHAALGAQARVARLDAPAPVLRARIRDRVRGAGPLLAGDDLREADEATVQAVAATAERQRAVPPRAGEQLIDAAAEPAVVADRVRAALR
ncbi:hypothetical protein K8F61_09965 [Microbacterium resistens]|uniref:AAA domain-containing protein n=1 Tax=Microbacterium resistens TaxID=156977 RepID=A0ABY3RN81_9MICO|nr:hypothetical protein [Microbacterium resistens]UGS25032.1 hypothetical protein K8F61_09965 [Microbacterium resistens]